jgi:hypothetical protein
LVEATGIWLLVWTIIVPIYSFRLDARGQPVSDWLDGLKIVRDLDCG